MSKLGCLMMRGLFQFGDFFDIHFQKQDLSEILIEKDLHYADDDSKGHLFDIYKHKNNTETSPTIIDIHGGGLFAAYKEVSRNFNIRWAKRGYNVVSISYRRLPDVTMTEQINDVMAALKYVCENREKLSLNMEDVFLVGDSAGALLSLFALAVGNSKNLQDAFGIEPHGIRFKGVNAISIMLKTVREDILNVISDKLLSETDRQKPFAKYILDPTLLINEAELAPMFLITSEEDLIQKETLQYYRLLSQAGVEARLVNEPTGKKHKLVHVFPVKYSAYEESERISGQVDEFFKELLNRGN